MIIINIDNHFHQLFPIGKNKCCFKCVIAVSSSFGESPLNLSIRLLFVVPTVIRTEVTVQSHFLIKGHYLHIEASQMLAGHRAHLISSLLRGSRGPQCLLFFYHMYGSGTGELSILLRSESEETDRLLWVRSGEQGISWLRASVSFQHDHQHQVSELNHP